LAVVRVVRKMDARNVPLDRILQQRRWRVSTEPFPHVVAYDVFTPAFYGWLDHGYGELLDRGLSQTHDPTRFSRNIKNYDAYSTTFSDVTPEAMAVFISREWHDMIANIMGVCATGDVNGGFHYHAKGSKSGQVHNDLNPGWFADNPNPFAVNLSRNEVCNYSTGKAGASGVSVHQTVRAVALLFYLHNPPWKFGDGGETGLYSYRDQPVHEPTIAVPPINNSLFMFECRPNSYHSFLENRNAARNSIIMWLHRPFQEAVARWGEKSIVYWSDRPKNQPV
jgi:2-oxoglutarate-Fe(II)-dependent oxygenase superfamily protein